MTNKDIELGQKVYVLYEWEICRRTVDAIGIDHFIDNDVGDENVFPDSVVWYFEDYGTLWWFTWKEVKNWAKAHKYKIKHTWENAWEVTQ